jgi:hypothetical protein
VIGTPIEVRSCEHRMQAKIGYVKNDRTGPPVLYVEHVPEASIVSLTNQVIRVSCPKCFELIRQSAKYSPVQ